MIRILQVFRRMDLGGAETSIMNILRILDRTKIQFDFLVNDDREGTYDKEILSLGGKIYHVRPRNQGYWKSKGDLERFFQEHREYKIVHMHASSQSDIMPLATAARYGVPVRILHSRNNNVTGIVLRVALHKALHYFHRYMCRRVITDRLAISELAAKWMFGEKAWESGIVKIVRNGIEIEPFIFDGETRREIRESLGIAPDDYVLGHVGRLTRQKNHGFLLEIVSRLIQQGMNCRLVMIGDGSERTWIEERVRAYGMEGRTIMLSARRDISRYYNVFDAFIFPSLFEGLGRVLIEAQVNGLPVLASADVIPREACILSTFKFVPLSDIEAWTNAISVLSHERLREAPALVRAAGYDIHAVAKEMEAFYLARYSRCR